MGAAAELTIYRIVQESLTNTIKHAGASCVQVTLRFADPVVELRVADDGAPVPSSVAESPPSACHGLNGMREPRRPPRRGRARRTGTRRRVAGLDTLRVDGEETAR